MRSAGFKSCRSVRQERGEERGFALLMALTGLAFLSFVAAATIRDTRHTARLSAARAGEIEAATLAEAGIARATLAIDEAWSLAAWPENGAPLRFPFGGGHDVGCREEVELARLVGDCDSDFAAAVLKHVGMAPERERAALAALRRARAQAALAHRTLAPASLEELAEVIGLKPAETEALSPFVTVHSGLGGFDEIVAPPALVALIPGPQGNATPRALGPARADLANRPPSPAPAFTAPSPRHIFSVRAEACTSAGHFAAREVRIARRESGDIARLEMREPISPKLLMAPCAPIARAAATKP